uniref:Uncharacterized protein n=1 Tax=Anguilla anguilla TaxID=7936 RepID=A0A0E9RWY9_ANGAN
MSVNVAVAQIIDCPLVIYSTILLTRIKHKFKT